MVQRINLVATARELVGTPYENGQTVRHADRLPVSIDCSGAMSWVSFKLFNSDARLTACKTNTTTARLMFMYLAEVTEPQPGDLAFYASSASTDVAHVMMVTDKSGVIGACDEAGQVNEYPRVEYTSRWIFRGYRAFPL